MALMYLADSCALLAFLGGGDTAMTAPGLAAMRSEVVISPITIWELTHKAALGKLPPLPTERGSFCRHLTGPWLSGCTVAWEDAEAANNLPAHHKDSMDRMLIASALRSDLTIITNDAVFSRYGVRTVW